MDCASEMACFKFLFYICCFRTKKTKAIQKGSERRKTSKSSSCTGDGGAVSAQFSPQGQESSNISRSRPKESIPSLDEDVKLVSLTPRSLVASYGSQDEKVEEISVPLISVLDCSDKTSEMTADLNENLGTEKQDIREEKASACSDLSQTSLSSEDEAEIPMAENSKKSSLATQSSDIVEPLPSYQSHSQLSASTEPAHDVNISDANSGSGEEEHFGNVRITGDILFGLAYNYKAGSLEVHVKECRHLSAVDVKKNRSDPYVKGYLLPDRSKTGKRKTKVKKNSLNPVFEEVLKFPVTVGELETRTLWLSVWHSHFGRNEFLGEVLLPLEHAMLENYGYKRHVLKERVGKKHSVLKYNGDIVLALKFLPSYSGSVENQEVQDEDTRGDLYVLVKEAKNLIPAYANGTSNPFCKSYLLPEKNKTCKQKTAIMKKTCNPKWDHTFIYSDVTLADLRERCLELTIWSYDKISTNTFLGGVRLSLGGGKHEGNDVEWMDSAGDEVNLWDAMLRKSGNFVEACLLLRAQMHRT